MDDQLKNKEEQEQEEEEEEEEEEEVGVKGKVDKEGTLIVVVTNAPSSTGCYYGMEFDELELYQRTSDEVFGPSASYEVALSEAIYQRDTNCCFQSAEKSLREEWRDEGPPYYSSSIENDDEDEAYTIAVEDKARYEEGKAREKAEMQTLWEKKCKAAESASSKHKHKNKKQKTAKK